MTIQLPHKKDRNTCVFSAVEHATSQPTVKLTSPLLERRPLPSCPHPRVEMLCLPPTESNSASSGPKTQVATLQMPALVSMDAASVENWVMGLVPANPVPDPRVVVTPLNMDHAEVICCKCGLYEDWKYIITGLWEGFDVSIRETPPCTYIF
jgi:hypothetical protein